MSLRRMVDNGTDEWPETGQEAVHMLRRAAWHLRASDRANFDRILAREILLHTLGIKVWEMEIDAWAA